jgi:hypothetical protein
MVGPTRRGELLVVSIEPIELVGEGWNDVWRPVTAFRATPGQGSPVPKGDLVMAGQDTNRDPEVDVELGEQVDAAPRTRAKNALVAVRLPGELLERVDAYARANGLTVSGVLRQGAERLVSGSIEPGPFIVSSTILVTGAAQFQALPSGGMGRSEQISGVSDDRPELTLAG